MRSFTQGTYSWCPAVFFGTLGSFVPLSTFYASVWSHAIILRVAILLAPLALWYCCSLLGVLNHNGLVINIFDIFHCSVIWTRGNVDKESCSWFLIRTVFGVDYFSLNFISGLFYFFFNCTSWGRVMEIFDNNPVTTLLLCCSMLNVCPIRPFSLTIAIIFL